MPDPNRSALSWSLWVRAGLVMLGALALCWPALDNGYPLTFQDTGLYLSAMLGYPPHPLRTIGYGLFVDWVSVGSTLWTLVAVQALVTSLLLVRVADLVTGGGGRGATLAALGLASVLLLSAGAKYVSWIMADVMTSWIFLAGLVFVLSNRWFDRVAAVGILALATLAHASHAPLVAVMSCAGALAGAWWLPAGDRMRRGLMLLTLLGLLLVAWVPLANRLAGMETSLLRGWGPGLMYRFIDTGVASKTLERYCDKRHWISCGYREEYARHIGRSDGWFLFNRGSLLYTRLGGWDASEPKAIVAHAFRCCLRDILWTSAIATWDQLWKVDHRDGLSAADVEPARFYLRAMRWHSDLDALAHSRQAVGAPVRVKLHPFSESLLYELSFAAALAIVCAAGLRRTIRGQGGSDAEPWLLLGGVLAFVVANAAICALGSTTHDRYQGRVAWLLPYGLGLFALRGAIAEPGGRRRVRMRRMEQGRNEGAASGDAGSAHPLVTLSR